MDSVRIIVPTRLDGSFEFLHLVVHLDSRLMRELTDHRIRTRARDRGVSISLHECHLMFATFP
jgi:hypothetical protein